MAASGKDYAITVARLTLGATAMAHGIADTFGIWGGTNRASTAGAVAASTDAPAELVFYAVSIGLLAIGLLLLVGAWSRAAALAGVALVVWHGIANSRFGGWFVEDGGCELVLALVALGLVVATHGPGPMRVQFKHKSAAKP